MLSNRWFKGTALLRCFYFFSKDAIFEALKYALHISLANLLFLRYCMAREPEHNKPLHLGEVMRSATSSAMPSLHKQEHITFIRRRQPRLDNVEGHETRDFVGAQAQEKPFMRRLSENRFVL